MQTLDSFDPVAVFADSKGIETGAKKSKLASVDDLAKIDDEVARYEKQGTGIQGVQKEGNRQSETPSQTGNVSGRDGVRLPKGQQTLIEGDKPKVSNEPIKLKPSENKEIDTHDPNSLFGAKERAEAAEKQPDLIDNAKPETEAKKGKVDSRAERVRALFTKITGGATDVYALAGGRQKEARRAIMQEILGRKATLAESGLNNVRQALFDVAGISKKIIPRDKEIGFEKWLSAKPETTAEHKPNYSRTKQGNIRAFATRKAAEKYGKAVEHPEKEGKFAAEKATKEASNEVREPQEAGVSESSKGRAGGGVSDYYNNFKTENDILQYIADMRKQLSKGEIKAIPPEVSEYMYKNRDKALAGVTYKTESGELKSIADVHEGGTTLYSNPFFAPELYKKIGKAGQKVANDIMDTLANTRTGNALSDLKKAATTHKAFTDMDKIIGELTGTEQIIDLSLKRLSENINKLVPKDRQEAITHYLQAGGDEGNLREMASKVKKKYRKGFDDAANLTDAEKAVADFLRKEMDKDFDAAQEAGVIESYVENYVRGMWDRPNETTKNLIAAADSGLFKTNPAEAKKKIFDSYFDGIQAGYTPKDLRIGFLFATGRRSIHRAIAARKALAELMKAKHDGEPVVIVPGAMGRVSDSEKSPLFIKPHGGKVDYTKYEKIEHPAMRGWKWIGNENGKDVLMEGDMYVYTGSKSGTSPYKRLNAILGVDKVKNWKIPEYVPVLKGAHVGDGLLKLSGFVKGTILIGPFHQFHLGEHAIFHRVNPFNAPEIDLHDPLTRELLSHGLMAHSRNAMTEFAEGLLLAACCTSLIGRSQKAQAKQG